MRVYPYHLRKKVPKSTNLFLLELCKSCMGEVAGAQLQNPCTAQKAHVMITFKIKVPYVIDTPTCVYRNPQTIRVVKHYHITS